MWWSDPTADNPEGYVLKENLNSRFKADVNPTRIYPGFDGTERD